MTERAERRAIAQPLGLLRHAQVAGVVSVIYIWSYFMTVNLVAPVQTALLPSVTMSLMFFPHGVRVLSAWIYGWRSFLYLLPGAMICNLHFAGDRALDPVILLGTFGSLIAAPLAFALIRQALPAVPLAVGRARLVAVFGAGFVASVFNLTFLRLAYGLDPLEGVVIFLGDTSGLLASALLLALVLRALSRRI
jgi:hypothetical protein